MPLVFSHIQLLSQTLAKKEPIIASEIGIEMLSAFLQADRVSRTLKLLWCTTEKTTLNTSIKPLILDLFIYHKIMVDKIPFVYY